MNLKAPELLDSLPSLTEKLKDVAQGQFNLGSITKSFNFELPKLDGLSSILSNVLPQNLAIPDVEGVFNLISPSQLQDTVKNTINQAQDLIETEIRAALDQALSTVQQAKEVVDKGLETISSLGNALNSNQSGFFDSTMDVLANITSMGEDNNILSKFNQSISQATDTIKNLSPKEIRDLADPVKYQEMLQTTLQTANTLLEKNILETAQEYVQVPASIGAVTSLFTTANSLLGAIGPKSSGEKYTLEASISTYYGKGDGADVDAYKKKSATGKQLSSGKSCAVDNVKILYNSKVEVPGLGTFTAVDKLKGGGADIQLYYETSEQAVAAQSKIKGKVLVTVTPPAGGGGQALQVTPRGNDPRLI